MTKHTSKSAKPHDKKPETKSRHTPHKKTHKKVFDIVPPGKTPAALNSRSVVPSDKPPVPDDQFVPSKPRRQANNPNEKHALLDHQPITLQPAGQAPQIQQTPEADDAPVIQSQAPATPEPAVTPSAPELPVQPAPVTPAHMQAAEPVVSEATSRPLSPSSGLEADAEEVTPGRLAVEQVVEAEAISDNAAAAHAPLESQSQTTSRPAAAPAANDKSIDELLAESGAPVLEPERPLGPLVSHHKSHRSWVGPTLTILIILLLAVVGLNFLLDARIIQTDIDLPHTDLL